MRLPRSWKQVTVEEYQIIYPLLSGEINWTSIISFFSGKTNEQVEEFDLKFYKYCVKALSFLLTPVQPKTEYKFFESGLLKSVGFNPKPKYLLKLGKKVFKASRSVDDINNGRYISIKTLLGENNEIDILHDLCALTYEENIKKGFGFSFKYNGDNHVENSKLFLKAPMSVAYPAVFFCSEVLMNWTLNTPDYLEGEKMLKENLLQLTQTTLEKDLSNIGHGMQQ